MGVVPNLKAALTDKLNKIIPPWNSFFQQFTAVAKEAEIPTSPYTPNTQGNLIFITAPASITLTRGSLNITMTGQKIVPVAVGDTVTWSGGSVRFLRTFSQ